ncbi:MAG: Type III restriction enzyme, res subunit:DEAD/DEAH box helicase, N-terminal [uncultured Chloroflexia bacterium]|uniref:Type III restriction enzyme, res subunit:DEAD/DEAH box helicase, N-terminal n=1 Tax=uncultured Chloroflexia bacterium TaxID=1672391 RepID=A0A6J4J9L1_9CHLR|nr:MAG: Type III restriction enzyme, res subunit:DEAD/DEAH box helicase, N-terminal [uncultured Chloroflexia bacterium]
MAPQLQIKFDPSQDYQLEAVQAVADLFDGLPERIVEFGLGEEIVANLPEGEDLSESWLEDNLFDVQRRNGTSNGLEPFAVDNGDILPGVGYGSHSYPHFTIEMETGTGKTYVYLRTIYELRKRYGFTKFIIVVPSIAIYEGVVKNFNITRDHFRALYGNEPTTLVPYDGAQLSRLRSFATSTFTEIMVITLDAFNKPSNNIYKASEKLPGERRPYQFIQETRPILILDEPQNMESEKAKQALRTLHPLFALRYSATHRTSPNLIYRLTPFEAFRRDLVKRIQVHGVTEHDNFNQPFLALEAISTTGGITARVKTYATQHGRTQETSVTLKHGDDLYAKTHRDEHKDGYRVAEIHAGEAFVQFENGIKLDQGTAIGPSRVEVFRTQIRETILQHMRMQDQLEEKQIKVLSLFFIDRVANYVDDDGLVKRLFDEEFDKLRPKFRRFADRTADKVREAYFARKKAKGGDEVAVNTSGSTNEEREAERAAFALIMRDKEHLLSFDEPISFIFAHSALKEGWDNPNVFQICTLNQTVSEVKKRQEIGRGLRLCVDQTGNRVFGDEVNLLTVVANESYKTYAERLQQEYRDDGDTAPPPPRDARRRPARRNNAIFAEAEFRAFWEKLSRRVRPVINVDTPALIAECVTRLNNATFPEPIIVVEKAAFVVTRYTLTLKGAANGRASLVVDTVDTDNQTSTRTLDVRIGENLGSRLKDPGLDQFTVCSMTDGASPSVDLSAVTLEPEGPATFETEAGQRVQERATIAPEERYPVPNLLDRTARETGLTRSTVNAIFKALRDAQKRKLLKNPEGFAGVFIAEVRNALAQHIADRLTFALDEGPEPWDLDELFPPVKSFPQRELIPAGDRGLYDEVQKDSGEEETFVDALKNDPNVLFYFKFPPAFKVHLPKVIGNYNPDWGIARRAEDGTTALHLIRETKGTVDLGHLRFPHERRKIDSAKKYFAQLGLDYRPIKGNTPGWWRPEDMTQAPLITQEP